MVFNRVLDIWDVQTNRHCSLMSDDHVDFSSHQMLELVKNNRQKIPP